MLYLCLESQTNHIVQFSQIIICTCPVKSEVISLGCIFGNLCPINLILLQRNGLSRTLNNVLTISPFIFNLLTLTCTMLFVLSSKVEALMGENSKIGNFGFQELDVWQKAVNFANDIITIAETINIERKHFRLLDQLEAVVLLLSSLRLVAT